MDPSGLSNGQHEYDTHIRTRGLRLSGKFTVNARATLFCASHEQLLTQSTTELRAHIFVIFKNFRTSVPNKNNCCSLI